MQRIDRGGILYVILHPRLSHFSHAPTNKGGKPGDEARLGVNCGWSDLRVVLDVIFPYTSGTTMSMATVAVLWISLPIWPQRSRAST